MITTNSKIQLVKPMGYFTNVGEVCEVINIMKDGSIAFNFNNGKCVGVMSYDEYLKYFTLFEDKSKEKKRKWTKWTKETWTYFNVEGDDYLVHVEYRHDGKHIQARTVDTFGENNKKFHAKASCNDGDKFVLANGLYIVYARLALKLMEYKVDNLINEIAE